MRGARGDFVVTLLSVSISVDEEKEKEEEEEEKLLTVLRKFISFGTLCSCVRSWQDKSN